MRHFDVSKLYSEGKVELWCLLTFMYNCVSVITFNLLCWAFTHLYFERSSLSTHNVVSIQPISYAGISYLLFYLEGFMFVLWLDWILPNLPVRPQGFWFPAVQEHRSVRRYRPSELRAEGTENITALEFYFTVQPKKKMLLITVK